MHVKTENGVQLSAYFAMSKTNCGIVLALDGVSAHLSSEQARALAVDLVGLANANDAKPDAVVQAGNAGAALRATR